MTRDLVAEACAEITTTIDNGFADYMEAVVDEHGADKLYSWRKAKKPLKGETCVLTLGVVYCHKRIQPGDEIEPSSLARGDRIEWVSDTQLTIRSKRMVGWSVFATRDGDEVDLDPPQVAVRDDLTLHQLLDSSQLRGESERAGNCIGQRQMPYPKRLASGTHSYYSVRRGRSVVLTAEVENRIKKISQSESRMSDIIAGKASDLLLSHLDSVRD